MRFVNIFFKFSIGVFVLIGCDGLEQKVPDSKILDTESEPPSSNTTIFGTGSDSADIITEYYDNGKLEEYNYFKDIITGPNQTVYFDSTGFIQRIKFNQTSTPCPDIKDDYINSWTEIQFKKDGTFIIKEVGR